MWTLTTKPEGELTPDKAKTPSDGNTACHTARVPFYGRPEKNIRQTKNLNRELKSKDRNLIGYKRD